MQSLMVLLSPSFTLGMVKNVSQSRYFYEYPAAAIRIVLYYAYGCGRGPAVRLIYAAQKAILRGLSSGCWGALFIVSDHPQLAMMATKPFFALPWRG